MEREIKEYDVVLMYAFSGKRQMFRVKSWNVQKVHNAIRILNRDITNKNSKFHRFQFEHRKSIRERTNISYTVTPHILDVSKRYYINGYIETIEDVEAKHDELLFRKMNTLNWNKVIRGIYSDWVEPYDDDCVLLEGE